MWKIQSGFDLPHGADPSYQTFVLSIEQLLEKIIPPEVGRDLKKLEEMLPLIIPSPYRTDSDGLSITTLCVSTYAHGTGRFISDMLSRWLIPGKILELGGTRTFAFHFEGSSTEFLINERFARVKNREDYDLIYQNFPTLALEIRLTLQAVFHARHLISVKRLSLEEKRALIQENISSLIDRPSKEFDLTIFDQMHQFFIKLSAEEKINQIKAQITPLLKLRTRMFDRDLFAEIQHFVLLFREKFTATRTLRYISRLISYQYLFRKFLQMQVSREPSKRHISLKVFNAKTPTPVLGILTGISLLRENEIFKKKHFKEAILSCFPHAVEVPDSFVVDWRSDKVPTFYMEIEQSDKSAFSMQEVKRLRQRLPQELRERIEKVSHPLFISRNEEEVMRHIVILSNELKYVNDIPQVVINFHNQTHLELTFNVVLVRLLKPNTPSLKKALPSHAAIEEVKTVGHLRSKYPKEASVFKITLTKAPFFRKDYSLDLNRARHAVVTELTKVLGDIRDYNGGMIAKQAETLAELRTLLHEAKVYNDFLMENFFYAIKPGAMQSLLSPSLLKQAFLMLIEALDEELKEPPYSLASESHRSTFIVVVTGADPELKDKVNSQLNLPSADLTFSSIRFQERSCLVFFLHSIDEEKQAGFVQQLEQILSAASFDAQQVSETASLLR